MRDFINKNKKVIMILGIVIILSGIGFAVAYTMDAINVSIGTGQYGVVYTGTATLPSAKLEPVVDSAVLSSTDKIIKINFTVKGASTNPTNKSIIYDVSLTNLNIPGTARSEHLKWMLYKNGSKISEGSFSPEFDALVNRRMVLTNIQQDLPKYSSTADSYIFYMWISEACVGDITTCTTDMDISGITDKTISGEIRIELSTGTKKILVRPLSEYENIFIGNMPVPNAQYVVNTSVCSDIELSYDYAKKGFRISNVSSSDKISCSPTVTQTTRTTLSNYIIDLVGSNNSVSATLKNDGSTLEKITDNGELDYRYRGINPNNYIWFNDELWRIIGVFDQNSHGIIGKKLVKIIRNESIGGYVFDNDTESTYGRSNFPTSDIYKLLNNAYYNSLNGTGDNYCYAYYDVLPGSCNFTGRGIKLEYRNMIESRVNWFLGGDGSGAIEKTSSAIYKLERGTNVYSGNDVSTYAAGVTTPIALMYASDYGYAAPSSCKKTLSEYSTAGCADSNWLLSYLEPVLFVRSDSSHGIFYIGSNGSVSGETVGPRNSIDIRPTLYLNSDVYYISGSGTALDPYKIG